MLSAVSHYLRVCILRLCVHMYLLLVLFGIWQHGGDVEHDLVALVYSINRMYPCGIICKI